MKDNRFFAVLCVILLFAATGQLANTIFVPAMSDIAHSFGIFASKTQAIMAFYLIAFGLSQLIYGPLSDRLGRKPVMHMGMFIFIISSFGAAFAPTFPLLLAASFAQGSGIGASGVMSRTVMRDIYNGSQLHTANSYVSMGLIFTPLLAPIIGGWLTMQWNWQACFIFLGIFGIACWAVIQIGFEETLPKQTMEQRLNPMKSYRVILTNDRFHGFIICLMATFGGIAIFEATAGVLFGKVMGYSPKEIAWMFIVPIPGYFLGSWLSSKLFYTNSLNQIMTKGISLMLLGGLSMILPALAGYLNVAAILIPAFIYFAGTGIIFPTATTGAIEPFPHMAGTAGAVLGSLQNFGAGLATLISATLPLQNQLYLGYILTALSIIALLAYMLKLSPENNHEKVGA